MSEVSSSELESLLAQQAAAKILTERRNLARRLQANPDFRKLIVEGFMGTDCARYAQESADPMLEPDARASALAMAQAAGHLKRFLWVIEAMAVTPERDMPALERAIEEARAGEDAE